MTAAAVLADQIARAINRADSRDAPPALVVPADVIAAKIGQANGASEATLHAPARKNRKAKALPKTTSQTPSRKSKRANVPTDAKQITPADVPAQAKQATTASDAPPARDIHYAALRLLARTLDDLEETRIEIENRVRAFERDGIPQPPWLEGMMKGLRQVEHDADLAIKREWRKNPLAPWAKTIPGAGEVLMGRLIGEIGDPADRPNVAKLRAYCGHGAPERAGKIPKGATQEELFKRGSPNAKKATWKLAYQFMRTVGTPDEATEITDSTSPTPRRARSPYRDIYDERKAATEGKLHTSACVRCGPAGHPALPGTPWSDAHRHADALRVVGKRFLVDLWVAARAIRESESRLPTPAPLPEESE